jgi:hypothetical protein
MNSVHVSLGSAHPCSSSEPSSQLRSKSQTKSGGTYSPLVRRNQPAVGQSSSAEPSSQSSNRGGLATYDQRIIVR